MRGHHVHPKGRLGLPRPAGRARDREGARLHLQGRHRALRRGRVQRQVPRVGAALHRRVGRLTERIGFWIDTDDAYFTLANEYVESVWWSLKQVWEKGLLNEGHKVVPYCPRCGTALSSHEVALGYRDAIDPSRRTSASRCCDEPSVSLLAWTTMPWTLVPHAAHRGRSRRDLRARAARRRRADPRRGAGRAGARRGGRDRASACPGADLLGPALRAALPLHLRLRRPRPHRARRRLRHDRGRHRRRAHRRGLRRGRLPARHRTTG